MTNSDFFPRKPDVNPRIYAFADYTPETKGLIRIGFTTRTVDERMKEHFPTKRPGKPYEVLLDESAVREDGSIFYDRDLFKYLKKRKIRNPDGDWFECDLKTIKAAIVAVKNREENVESRIYDFKMRPEQLEAVVKTSNYFKYSRRNDKKITPHFLWNAKMRFGKTFAAYQLAKKENWKKILVLTFKPAVQNAWEEDLLMHKDFEGWQFVSKKGLSIDKADKSKPIVCFGSFQDYLGKNKLGGIKSKNEWVHTINWDCVILDEYHFGAWRENAKELIGIEEKEEAKFVIGEGSEYFDPNLMPITTRHYLYLSGTPFKAIATGEFLEDQIFNWTYTNEQEAKNNWRAKNNPYKSLPRMVMMTYKLPKSLTNIIDGGEYDEFDLNHFFAAKGNLENAKFLYEEQVQKWLDLIRGALKEKDYDDLKHFKGKPYLPFSHPELLSSLNHTLWFLPNVASCYAMRNLIKRSNNTFYHDYKVVVAAGKKAGIGINALPPVYKAMDDPLKSKTITLTCTKLTQGVSVRPWTGIFMLRNLATPETYFQSAFRVQTPWTIKKENSSEIDNEIILKKECYIFDFAPNRALKLIQDYGSKLNTTDDNIESKINEVIKFLPVICYDGSRMEEIDASQILDIIMSGTTATLLARKWDDATLVHVDNQTLERLMKNKDAIDALMNIEGFRNIKDDITAIINKSEKINKIKKKANTEKISKKDKKELTDEEKEYRNLRKQVREKLLQFATRIPVFMYLTDYREQSLEDVIRKIEPGLFQKVTGLKIIDFEKLVSLGVFDKPKMNEAVYKFKRYEDSSLTYMGFAASKENRIGLWDTVIKKNELKRNFIER